MFTTYVFHNIISYVRSFNSLSPSAVLIRRIKPVPHTERRIETSQNIIV